MLRVVIADDSYLVREALTHLLDSDPRVDLVASARTAVNWPRRSRRRSPTWSSPTSACRRQATRRASCSPTGCATATREIGVVVVSQYADPRYGLALLDKGSDGRAYLLKDRLRDREHLLAAIFAVAAGGSVVDAKVVEALITARAAGQNAPLAELTRRELEILGRMAQGKSNQAIAEELFLSKRAVEKHINVIFMKLGPRPRRATSADASRRR